MRELERLFEHISVFVMSRAMEAQKGMAELATLEQETGYLASGTALSLNPNTSNTFLVEAVVASVPAGAGGVVTLGPAIIPVLAGVTVLSPMKLRLELVDARTLTSSSAGPLSLVLMGRQLSKMGLIR